jgi:aminoglycoside 3-N-acetyltransferase
MIRPADEFRPYLELATAERMAEQLLSLGLRPGGVLLVHSSLRSLGPISGGAETVIEGLLRALGPEGTLLLPAFSYNIVTAAHPFFDLRNTASNVGALPEYFRKRSGTLRSMHPTHSVCAVGKEARSLLANHVQDFTPCGPNSPITLLPGRSGQILMLGCGLGPNTSMHGVEERTEPPYLFGPDRAYQFFLPEGGVASKVYRPHGFDGWRQRYDRLDSMLPPSVLRVGKIFSAAAHLLEAHAMWEIAEDTLRRDPFAFVERRPSS